MVVLFCFLFCQWDREAGRYFSQLLYLPYTYSFENECLQCLGVGLSSPAPFLAFKSTSDGFLSIPALPPHFERVSCPWERLHSPHGQEWSVSTLLLPIPFTLLIYYFTVFGYNPKGRIDWWVQAFSVVLGPLDYNVMPGLMRLLKFC